MENQNVQTRPPVVTVLGHVDHGKTTLLDAIRETNLASREAGGITQSIGAWTTKTQDGEKITFIDTPGHEAFNKMRQRGAEVADIAILVVAADDGVMPQTKESIKYLREAQTPFIIALTKTDLAGANPEAVKNQLAEQQVFLEGRGGDIIALEISAKTGKGIKELLEMIILLAQVNGLTGNSEEPLSAVVIETELNRQKGPTVSCIVKNGALKIGQKIIAGNQKAKVRGLFDDNEKPIKKALPGMPAEILGFSVLPEVGTIIEEKEKTSPRSLHLQKKTQNQTTKDINSLTIVLKADTAGSLEAIESQISNKVNIVSKGIGDISENDLNTAYSTKAALVAFNIKIGKNIQKSATEQEIKVYPYRIIYELLQDIDRWAKEKQENESDKILGNAEIIAEFPHNGKKIAGAKLSKGVIAKTNKMRLIRDNKILGQIHPISLRKHKEEVGKVEQGEEFGLYFEPQLDFQIGDMIESYVPRKSGAAPA